MSSQRTNEFLNLRSTNGFITIPTLCLNINQAEAELVFSDDSINAFITSLPDDCAGMIHLSMIREICKDGYFLSQKAE